MGVALLFIDGVGVGVRDPDRNPLARHALLLSQFQDGSGTALPHGGVLAPVDPTFGVPGRPQSATNQTAILTGDPAPQLLGKHLLGFPNPFLRDLLLRRSIVKRMAEAKRRATFANSYPAAYLDALGLKRRPSTSGHIELPADRIRKLRPSATTLAMSAGEVALRTFDDALAGHGLTHDITGTRAVRRGFAVPERTPLEAAEVFWRVAGDSDFALFEHYLADEAGHAQDFDAAERALCEFDAFARAVVASRPAGWHVLVCSDHGNVEDLSTRSHTCHEVPVLWFGEQARTSRLKTVADVGALTLELLEVTA